MTAQTVDNFGVTGSLMDAQKYLQQSEPPLLIDEDYYLSFGEQ